MAYVFVDEVQATVTRNEASDLLAVLDQLDSHTLTNGRVGLLGLKTAAREKWIQLGESPQGSKGGGKNL